MPTDLSERADRAVERAFVIAGGIGAEVVVLHVVDDALPPRIARVILAEARDRIANHLAGLQTARGVARQIAVETGQPHRVILRRAAQCDPVAIVLGMHRETGFADFFRGTTVARVAFGGVWPVLVARNAPDRPYEAVLVGIDFSEASVRALRVARRLAPGATRRLLHAYAAPLKGYLAAIPGIVTGRSMSDTRVLDQEARFRMAEFGREAGETALPPIVEEGGFPEVLAEALAAVRPDLVAIGAHGRSGLVPSLLGSAATALMRDPPCDLLVA